MPRMKTFELKPIEQSKGQRCINLTNKVWQLGCMKSNNMNVSFSKYIENLILEDLEKNPIKVIAKA